MVVKIDDSLMVNHVDTFTNRELSESYALCIVNGWFGGVRFVNKFGMDTTLEAWKPVGFHSESRTPFYDVSIGEPKWGEVVMVQGIGWVPRALFPSAGVTAGFGSRRGESQIWKRGN